MPGSRDRSYPPADWTADDIEAALRTNPEAYPIPRYEADEAWQAIRDDPLTAPTVDRLVSAAESALEAPFPALPATHYLRWRREDDITQNQLLESVWTRWRQLSLFALAECLERDGRFLDPITDAAWAICEQSTWMLTPDNLSEESYLEGLPTPVDPGDRNISLRGAETGKLLAELGYLFGDSIHDALRERIRHEVDRRLLSPYEARDDFPWLQPPTANHNAVNNGSIGMAALYVLDSPSRQARILEKVARTLGQYLDSFDEDGCTVEGLGYWNYGMSHYVQLAANLAERTDGAFDLCSPPILDAIARYPVVVELSPGHYVPFSDSNERDVMDPHVACWLGEQRGLEGIAARGRETLARETPIPTAYVQRFLSDTLRDLAWSRRIPAEWDPERPKYREFCAGFDWWIARAEPGDPDGLVVAAKGGHNGESHNHNDCGSFVVHARGESLLTDPGCPIYHSDYFREGRYDYLVTRSIGHSVPYVNGFEQATGAEYAASVLDRTASDDTDRLSLALADCYPEEAGLESLVRTIELDRGDETIGVSDRATFRGEASTAGFESVLVSYLPMEQREGGLVVSGAEGLARIRCGDGVQVEVACLEDAIDMRNRAAFESDSPDLWRARISAPAGENGTGSEGEAHVALRIELPDAGTD